MLKRFLARSLFALCLLGMIASCAKKAAEEIPAQQDRQNAVEGSLAVSLEKILSDDYRESCDFNLPEEKLQLARAIDAKAAEIEAFSRANAGPAGRRVMVGPLLVNESLPSRAAKTGWQTSATSWKSALADYANLKDKPMNQAWVWLNSDVRSLLVEDTNRVLKFQNPFLQKDDGPFVFALEASLQDCVSAATCVEPQLPSYLEGFMARQLNYQSYQRVVKKQETSSEKRRQLTRFLKYVQSDASIFRFQPNPQMKKLGSGQYLLTMDPGALAPAGNQIKAYVEGIWRSPFAQVSLQWKDSGTSPDIFRVLVGTNMGERSFVIRSQKTVTLFPDVRVKSIAHEFGHVMGFNDRYYTVWNPLACEYTDHSREEDIMSSSLFGTVLDEHWQDLARYY